MTASGLETVSVCACRCCVSTAPVFASRRRYQRNLSRLNAALGILRLWPIDEETAAEFAELFRELRAAGRVMSQFDLLIAALARQRKLILLTADQDFRPVTGILAWAGLSNKATAADLVRPLRALLDGERDCRREGWAAWPNDPFGLARW